MMRSRLICDNGLKATENGFSVEIRLPWYRSLPLTSVEIVKVVVDEEVIANDSIELEIDQELYRVSELKEFSENLWFVLDSGFLHIQHSALAPSKEYEIEVTVALSPPYIKGLRRMVGARKQLSLRN